MVIINNKYYEGFEGEIEIDLIYKKNGVEIERLEIWNGYFSALLTGMLQLGTEPIGILHEYNLREGWYEDENPWKIPDIAQAITQFSNYSESNFSEEERPGKLLLSSLPKVLESIIQFLEKAKKNCGEVYIEYL